MSFTIGFVCTGNLCRSPAAELLLGAHVRDASSVALWSAGTRARPGEPIDPACAAILTQLTIDSTAHRSQRLAPAHLAHADLVLCAALEHRAAVLALAPHLMRRAFTIKEFVALNSTTRTPFPDLPSDAEAADNDIRRAIVRAAADQRGMTAPSAAGIQGAAPSLDIVDPLGAPPDEVRAVMHQIAELCADVASTLRLAPIGAQRPWDPAPEAAATIE